MKKITYILGLLLLVVTSCNQDFLDKKPLDEYSEVDVWSDPALIETFVNNFYREVGHSWDIDMQASYVDEGHFTPDWGVSNFNKSLLTTDDIPGWEVDWFGTATIQRLWGPMYKAIRATNIFFSKIDEVVMDDQDMKDRLTGETYFWRAYYYHYLTALYGGVPIIKEPYSLSDEFEVARNTYAECIDFIVSDLDAAAALLPVSYDGDNKGRATKGAALALKARVLLYAASDLHNGYNANGYSNVELIGYTGGSQTDRWTAAKNAAKAVIDMGEYSLAYPNPANAEEATANYTAYFTSKGESEDIFLRYYLAKTDENWDNYHPGIHNGPNGYHNWGNNTPVGNLVDAFEMEDGTAFDWDNPEQKADPYGIFDGQRRDPRFYANVLYDGARWRARPTDVANIDPIGIIQTGKWQLSSDPDDLRHGLDTRQGPIEDWNGGRTGYYLRKGIVKDIDAQFTKQEVPWRYMRLGEVYLNYAEACIELGEDDEAKKYINMIRQRAGMPDITETGEELKARYRNERRVELMYEEHRFFDVRRWLIGDEAYGDTYAVDVFYGWEDGATATQPTYEPWVYEERAWDDKCYFFPIKRDEMNKNSLLIQNPGY
ncbi:RagB/SusD family nutrient uptake outer membrane protein [uncultured Draconibacterium sp.]|uniref:RagB/SusD family nutrient uptake outer membrane protein n=1 Tax=uncultured Draconibacterium sp. TaxID=1573823 RepID=UPI002AA8C2DD|nr:RagB/SusD family nutrient uptake outer membrane protein [uncultured Draconibacterium sp.]